MFPPADGDDWLGLSPTPLPIETAYSWSVLPGCGAVVLFSGTARDHADGRTGVSTLTYEAYEGAAMERLAAVAGEVRRRWPVAGRVVLLHRTGTLQVGECAVVVVVSTPHRPEAFEAAQFAIDAVKASVPIWKHEIWEGGEDWGTGAIDLVDPVEVPSPQRIRR